MLAILYVQLTTSTEQKPLNLSVLNHCIFLDLPNKTTAIYVSK